MRNHQFFHIHQAHQWKWSWRDCGHKSEAVFLRLLVEGLVGTQIGRSRRPRDAHARVPFTAASVTAQPCRPDHDTVTRRLRVVVKTRCKKCEAFQHSRYMRVTLLVNQSRSTRRAGKVEHMSCAIGLTSATHLRYMHGEHPFMPEIASSPLTKLPCSPPRTNRAFGRLDGKWWLQELGEQWQRCKLFGIYDLCGRCRARESAARSRQSDRAAIL